MDVKKIGNKIVISHILKKNEGYKISESKGFRGITFYKKTQLCQGYSSKTEDGKHIILADYDHVFKTLVIDEIKAIQQRFNLPPAYLFTTKEKEENGYLVGNYHCVILSKHTSKEVFEILGHLSIDENFRDSLLRKASRSWVLRVGSKKGSGKPKFLEIIGNKNLNKKISTAHKKLLSKFFKEIKHPSYKNEDNLNKLNLQIYETKS